MIHSPDRSYLYGDDSHAKSRDRDDVQNGADEAIRTTGSENLRLGRGGAFARRRNRQEIN
jgi:hypothetical protein